MIFNRIAKRCRCRIAISVPSTKVLKIVAECWMEMTFFTLSPVIKWPRRVHKTQTLALASVVSANILHSINLIKAPRNVHIESENEYALWINNCIALN